MIGLLIARRAGLGITAPALEGALAKLERVLPDGLRAQVNPLRSVGVHLDAPRARAETRVIATLSAAARAGRRIRLRYRAFGGEETEREFDPYGVVCQQGRWYAAGHDHLRGAPRTFRLDRVLQAELGDGSFDRLRDFDALAHVERAIASAPIGRKVEVLLETTLDDARRQLPPMSAILEAVPGGVLLRHQAYHPDGLGPVARLHLGFDCPLVVLTPPELRAALRALAARANDLANREGAEPIGRAPDRAGTSAQPRRASERGEGRGEALPPA